MTTNFEIRFLLVLWDLGGTSVLKGKVNDRFSGKTKDANAAREALVQGGAIELSEDGKRLTLTDAGKKALGDGLAQDGFVFKAQIGAKMANALLKWMRSAGASRTVVAKSEVVAIGSYEAFKVVVLEVFDRLNRDFKFDNLVPIYRIRQELGERVSRDNFDTWLLELQANDAVQLIGGEMPELTPAIAQDSIQTTLGSVRYYAKRI
ncbi:MAG: hypothetical protein HC860_19485 [Alkalinema sp. RU_4_3]|nr:hypothetical protein [Alkalinema sp. RU_4_3]